MNPSLMRSALKSLAPVTDRSRCRSFLAAPMTAVVSMADVSLTSYGGSGFLGGVLTKMISTAANGKRIFLLNGLKDYYPHYCKSSDGYMDNWEHDIDCFRRCRSEKQIREIFETWIMLFGKVYTSAKEKERRYLIFKRKVRFIEERGVIYHGDKRLGLDCFSDMTPKEYFAMKDQKSEQQ